MKINPLLQERWGRVARRDQLLLQGALALLLVALLWWLGLAPALKTLRSAPAQHLQLEAQLQQMQRLQTQAKLLQNQPRMAFDEARRALEASVKPLGAAAQLSIVGERATVNLKAISADALAQWLAQARLNARAAPEQAHLVRNAALAWDGTLMFYLGARQPQ